MSITINKNLMQRNHTAQKRSKSAIEYIVIHYVGALGDAKANTDYYKSTDVNASADFWVGFSGDIWQGNDYYNYYSWHCGGGLQGSSGASFFGKCKNSNSIGIEMCVKKRSTSTMNATDKDWYFLDATIESAAQLTASLMKELDIDINHVIRHYDVTGKICPNPFVYNTGNVSWEKFKENVSSYAGTTVTKESYYRVRKTWADSSSQLGAYTSLENAKANCPSGYSVFDESGRAVYTNKATTSTTTSGTQPSDIKGTEVQKASQMLELVHKCDSSGILYSVTTAQMILESGYVTTDLATNACNCFGMKCSLSGNTWTTVWDGKSKYTKKTAEQDANGNTYYVTADFRKYPNLEKSIQDHACYLTGAKNGNKLRYDGLTKCTDYKTAITLIKNGGYATDAKYVSKVCSIIEKYKLDKYDNEIVSKINNGGTSENNNPSASVTPYRVAVKYSGGKYTGQIGAYDILDNAKSAANSSAKEKKKTYYVYDNTGTVVYTAKTSTSSFKSYSIKVDRNDLRIRKEATTSSTAIGYIKPGTYTIVQEKSADGYTWGKLKSGVGWIALEYVTKIA